MDLRDSIQFLIGQGASASIIDIGGRKFSSHPSIGNAHSKIEGIVDPQAHTLEVSTLQGLCDLIDNKFEGHDYDNKALLHVVSHEQVNLILKDSDLWGRRLVVASAKLPKVEGFKFGLYHDHESFTVALLSQFVETDDRAYLLRISANIGDEAVKNSADDGITQMVSVRKGAVLRGTEALRNRVKLAPFRTFRELEQPASDFIFRVRPSDSGIPQLGLFEADGGAWKLEATKAILHFFDETLAVIS